MSPRSLSAFALRSLSPLSVMLELELWLNRLSSRLSAIPANKDRPIGPPQVLTHGRTISSRKIYPPSTLHVKELITYNEYTLVLICRQNVKNSPRQWSKCCSTVPFMSYCASNTSDRSHHRGRFRRFSALAARVYGGNQSLRKAEKDLKPGIGVRRFSLGDKLSSTGTV